MRVGKVDFGKLKTPLHLGGDGGCEGVRLCH
jgi:hypothetical protein